MRAPDHVVLVVAGYIGPPVGFQARRTKHRRSVALTHPDTLTTPVVGTVHPYF